MMTTPYTDSIVIDGTAPMLHREEEWPKWHEGGVTAVMATVATHVDCAQAVSQIGHWYRRVRKNPERLKLVTRTEQVHEAKRQSQLGVILAFQNTRPIGYDLNLAEVFARLGVRCIQLTYNVKNPVGDGCLERTDCGLSNFGKDLIAELNRVGIIVDLSHTGMKTTLEAMEASTRPVIFSHSNAREVHDHPRNLTNEQITAVAETGGVIGLNGFPAFVGGQGQQPTMAEFMSHLDHIVSLVGVDYVSLGIDYFQTTADEYEQLVAAGVWRPGEYPPPPWRFPVGIEDARTLENVAVHLKDKGYPDPDIRKVLGENMLRVFENVWDGESW